MSASRESLRVTPSKYKVLPYMGKIIRCSQPSSIGCIPESSQLNTWSLPGTFVWYKSAYYASSQSRSPRLQRRVQKRRGGRCWPKALSPEIEGLSPTASRSPLSHGRVLG